MQSILHYLKICRVQYKIGNEWFMVGMLGRWREGPEGRGSEGWMFGCLDVGWKGRKAEERRQ